MKPIDAPPAPQNRSKARGLAFGTAEILAAPETAVLSTVFPPMNAKGRRRPLASDARSRSADFDFGLVENVPDQALVGEVIV